MSDRDRFAIKICNTTMPDKLTDSEIKKALECCAINKNCKGCYFHTHVVDDMCPRVLMQNSLDLINCLEARIGVYETCNARKDEAIKHLESEVKRLQAENDRLKAENEGKDFYLDVEKESHKMSIGVIEHYAKSIKAEAYKEVFEKLNDKALVRKIKLFGNWFIVKGVTLHDINTLKKDMVGKDA